LVIQATQEAEIRMIVVQGQAGQILLQDPVSKKPFTERADGMAQGVGPEFKPQGCKKNTSIHK
jgi:hypothetical protein